MTRLADLSAEMREHLLELDCPRFEHTPLVPGPALAQRRVAIISTAGLHRRGDRPFGPLASDYRIIPGDVAADDLLMSHISVNFDRTGYQQDRNVVFPIDRLRELADSGAIGSLAEFHYSFMGATDPRQMEPTARELARLLRDDRVDAALLVPV